MDWWFGKASTFISVLSSPQQSMSLSTFCYSWIRFQDAWIPSLGPSSFISYPYMKPKEPHHLHEEGCREVPRAHALLNLATPWDPVHEYLRQDLRQERFLAESNSSENRPDFAESKWIHLVLRGHDGPWQLTRNRMLRQFPQQVLLGDLVITILQATKTHLASTFKPLWIIEKFCKGEDQVLCSTAGTWSWIQVVIATLKYWN